MIKCGRTFWMKAQCFAFLALAFCVFANQAAAQVEAQTGIADPGRIQKQFLDQPLLPQTGPNVNIKSLKVQGAPPGSENIRFKFGGIEINGATAYQAGELSALYKDKIGTEISLADLYAIANAMTLKYRNDGFILTQIVIPPQTIEGGIARLQIVEGYINNIQIQANEDEPSSALETIREYASRISVGGPLNAKDLERQLLLINDLPGVSGRSILSPSPNQPGAADLVIIIERDPFDGLIAADNFGSRFLGPVNFTAYTGFNSAFGNNELLLGQFVVAPDNGYELAFGSISYEQPVGPYGTKAKFLVSLTDTEPGFELEEFDVRGHSQLFSIQASHPFIRSRETNLSGYVLFDWRDVKSSNNIEATREDRIRALRLGGQLDFVENIIGPAVNSLGLELSHGLNILGASEEGGLDLTRDAGDPQFFKLEAQFRRLQRIIPGLNLLIAGEGQWADGALLSSEEFSVGGISENNTRFGRGFDPSEIVGDDGIAGTAELQWNNPVDADSPYIDSYQLFSFYDAGRTWDNDASANNRKTDTITSAGLGMRVDFVERTNVGLTVAFPLNRDVESQRDKDPKVYLTVNKRF